MKKLIVAGLLTLSSLFGVEDGIYKCITYSVVKGDIEYKFPEDKIISASLKLKNGKLYDHNIKYTYFATYKDFDIYTSKQRPNYLIILPGYNTGNKVFEGLISDKTKDYSVKIICKKFNSNKNK
jgi:hypothetical protein